MSEDSPHVSEKIRHLFVSELNRGEVEVRRLRGEIEMRKMAVSYRIIENPTGSIAVSLIKATLSETSFYRHVYSETEQEREFPL
jgi:hypothetical protein